MRNFMILLLFLHVCVAKGSDIIGSWTYDCCTYITDSKGKLLTTVQGCTTYTYMFNKDGSGYLRCNDRYDYYWSFAWLERKGMLVLTSTGFVDFPFLGGRHIKVKVKKYKTKKYLKMELWRNTGDGKQTYIILKRRL